MNHIHSTLGRTKNGNLEFCKHCGFYQLTFGQFLLELSPRELQSFAVYLEELDIDYWEDTRSPRDVKRRIPIPTQQANLCLMLNRNELYELKGLVFHRKTKKDIRLLNPREIDCDLIYN